MNTLLIPSAAQLAKLLTRDSAVREPPQKKYPTFTEYHTYYTEHVHEENTLQMLVGTSLVRLVSVVSVLERFHYTT